MSGAVAATLASLSTGDRGYFVAVLGGIFEHSPWVAELAWAARPFKSIDALHAAMVEAVREASQSQKLALIRAHPELAGKEAAAGTLTHDSETEQASVGINHCTAEELGRLRELNLAYREKFGFPFVMAVKRRSRGEILAAIASRAGNTREQEFTACLTEIGKIARLRLDALLS